MEPDGAPTSRPRLLLLLASALLIFSLFPRPVTPEEKQILVIGGGTIDLHLDGGPKGTSTPDINEWIRRAGEAVSGYFNGFPVPRLNLNVRLRDGSGVHGGKANGWGRFPTINIEVGRHGGPLSLKNDWTMTHEMIHLGFPSLPDEMDWMTEGLATYVEPVARTRAGNMSVNEYWLELARDMPQGIPGPYDRGFNQTHTWEATYWGGALFWFLADVEIRQATGGKKGLEDAIRAINKRGGTIDRDWSVDMLLATGDNATGVPVLHKLYDAWALRRGEVDFPLLLRRLGVSRTGDRIVFNDEASLAGIRKAMTKRYRPAT